MSIGLSTALSGVAAANERWRASSSQVSTTAADSRRLQARAAERGSMQTPSELKAATASQARQHQIESRDDENPAAAVVNQKSASYAFVANLRVLESHMNTSGALLDIQA